MHDWDSQHSPFSLALSVIVVAADSGQEMRECVRRILACSLPLELILMDNASLDGVPQAIERAHQRDTRLKVIYNHHNLGFGRAVNLAAKQAQSHALLILNPDCLPGEDDLQRLLAVQASHPKAGLIGAVVCAADGRPDSVSWRRDPLLRRSLNTLFGRHGDAVQVEQEIPHEVIEAEAISGALMLITRELFERLGGFDEKYFLHCEDLDLCWRVRDGGYQVLLAGDVRVMHGDGSSSRHRPVFVSRHKHHGMWRWFRSHDPAARNPLVAGVVWLGIWVHFVAQIPGQLWRLGMKKGNGERGTGNRD